MSRTASELAHLFRALKAPAAAGALPALAERAREESWGYGRFAEALLSTEVSSRDSHGGEGRIKAARFPARKTLEPIRQPYADVNDRTSGRTANWR
jgi:DNA replication protein DnaC